MTLKRYSLLICGLLCWYFAGAQATGRIKRVLFIGNSYTAVNNLPDLVSRFAASVGDSVFTAMSTPGGFTFQAHSTYSPTLSLIQQPGWDFVVLQEQSQLPSFPISQVLQQVFPYAKQLDSIIHHYNPCAKVVFYRTWGRQNGDQANCAQWPPICTYAGMDSLLALRYRQMADSNQALLCPVGEVWQKVRGQLPQVTLYQTDQSHPEIAGSYLAAASFYTLFFRTNPELATYSAGIDSITASLLRKIVRQVVLDTLGYWNIGKWEPKAAFSYATQGLTVQLTNQSQYSTKSLWYFGNGMTDTTWSPAHTYAQPGTYIVSLKTERCGLGDSTAQAISVTTTNSEDIDHEEDRFIKESDTYRWVWQTPPSNVSITSISGKRIQYFSNNQITALPGSVLILSWQRKGRNYVRRLVY